MRDLLLFALCCALAAAYWITSQRRFDERAAAMQTELYQLGAPQTMEDSPRRSLLLGEFAKGLRADPDEQTYKKLAPLFLVSHDQNDASKVMATAFHSDGMARVKGKTLEFFDPKGEPAKPHLWSLGQSLTAWDKPLFQVDASPTLVADGPWLLYTDKRRWAIFRFWGGELRGYISTRKLGVNGDDVLVEGEKRWLWSQGQLESSG